MPIPKNFSISSRAGALVWTTWAICTSVLVGLVTIYGRQLPWSDDWNMVPFITGIQPVSLRWLWAQHNEHRIVIEKLIFVTFGRLTNADFRFGIYLNTILLSSISAATIFVLKRVRGRTEMSDIFYPLFLMHLGLGAFHWGFELQFTLVTALVCAIFLILYCSGPFLNVSACATVGFLLILLPISGGNGLLYVPGITVWLAVRLFWASKSKQTRVSSFLQTASSMLESRATLVLLLCALVSLTISALYFIGYQKISQPWNAPSMVALPLLIIRVMSSAFGEIFRKFWPLMGFVTAAFICSSLVGSISLTFAKQRLRDERFRAGDLSAFSIGCLPLLVAVAYGRGGQSTFPMMHYSTLAIPIIFWSYLGWSDKAKWTPAIATIVCGSTCVLMSVLWCRYVIHTLREDKAGHRMEVLVEQQLMIGVPAEIIVREFTRDLMYIDAPEKRTLVRDGVDDFRKAGFARYGSFSKHE